MLNCEVEFFSPLNSNISILLTTVLFFFLFSGFSVEQPPDLSAFEGWNVTLQCTQISTSYNGMYWFRQRPSESLEPIVYYYANMETLEDKFKQKVSARKHGNSLDLTKEPAEHRQCRLLPCKTRCTA